MRRILLTFILSLALMVAGFAFAEEQLSLPIDVYVPEQDEYISIEETKVDGVIQVHLDKEGFARFNFDNAEEDVVYRLKISGIAADGNPFEINSARIKQDSSYYMHAADEAGVYGPYDFVVTWGENQVSEKICFIAENSSPEYGSGRVIEGYIDGNSFAELPPEKQPGEILIDSPHSGYYYAGRQGYTFYVRAEIPDLSNVINITIQDAKSGKVIGTYETDAYVGAEVSKYCSFNVPIEEPFESEQEYDLIITTGESSATCRVKLVDESTLKSNGPIQAYIADADFNRIPFEEFKQGDKYVLTTEPDGSLNFAFEGGVGVYHVKFSGNNPQGGSFSSICDWSDNVSFYGLYIYNRPGTYDSCTLEVTSGNDVMVYDIEYVVPQDDLEKEHGILINNDETDAPQFVRVDNKTLENAEPLEITRPTNGRRMSGRPGYSLPVEVRVYEPGNFKLRLIDCATGEEIDYQECTYANNPSWYGFSFEITERFSTGAEYELQVIRGKKTYTSRFTMILEPNPFAKKVDPATRTLVPATDGSVTIIDPESSYFAVPEGFEACSDAGLFDLLARASADFVPTPMEDSYKYWLLRSNPAEASDSLMQSFSFYTPAVSEEYLSVATDAPSLMADDFIYTSYLLQANQLKGLTDKHPLNLDKLKEFFGKEWQPLHEFAFARRFFFTSNGAAYFITPVYYADEGGAFEDCIYLSVSMYAQPCDKDYLESLEVYLTEQDVYLNPSRAEHMIIADQQLVAEILNLMLDEADFEAPEDTTEYRVLAKGSKGDDVKALQEKLIALGYLTGKADGIFGNMSKEAISAYQQAMGLEVTGEADAEMQRALLFDNSAREYLKAWLEAHA